MVILRSSSWLYPDKSAIPWFTYLKAPFCFSSFCITTIPIPAFEAVEIMVLYLCSDSSSSPLVAFKFCIIFLKAWPRSPTSSFEFTAIFWSRFPWDMAFAKSARSVIGFEIDLDKKNEQLIASIRMRPPHTILRIINVLIALSTGCLESPKKTYHLSFPMVTGRTRRISFSCFSL